MIKNSKSWRTCPATAVSGWDISRSDFNMELAFAKKRYQQGYAENVFAGERGKALLNSIKALVLVARLVNEGIQMQEVQRAAYRVDSKIVDREFEDFMTQKQLDLEGLKASLEKNGYPRQTVYFFSQKLFPGFHNYPPKNGGIFPNRPSPQAGCSYPFDILLQFRKFQISACVELNGMEYALFSILILVDRMDFSQNATAEFK